MYFYRSFTPATFLESIMHNASNSTAGTGVFSWATGILIFLLLTAGTAFAQQTFTVAPNLIDISQAKGNETDPSIAFNPLSPSNMVVVAATDGTVPGLFVTITTNLGASWRTNVIATNNDAEGLIPAYGEPSVAWDAYGNVFLSYLPATFEGVAVAMSTNGGETFNAVTNLAALDATDQPRITTPFAGAASGSVWVVYKDYTTAGTPLQVQGALSTGLGTNGSFGLAQIVPGSGGGGFADIAVGPMGQVVVAFQDNLQGLPDPMAYPPANIWVSVETNAVSSNSLATNGFGRVQLVATDAIGGVTYINAAPTATGVNAAPGLGWDYDSYDTNYNRVCLVYTGIGPNGNAVINLMSSDGSGATWGNKTYVDDDAVSGSNDHFLPRAAVDPITGIIGCSWYDCRNDLSFGSPSVTNEFIESFTLTGYMVTNVYFTNNAFPVSETWIDTTGQGTNIIIQIDADNVYGAMMKSDKSDNLYIYGLTNTNFIINVAGTNTTGSATVTVMFTDMFTQGYTSGNGNQEAVMYASLSFDGGRTFLANQQLLPGNEIINAPAVGIASDVAGSDSLTGWGHYTALTAYGANFIPVWADNSDVTTNNPDGANANFDLYIPVAPGGMISVPTADLSVWVTNSPNPVISESVLVYSIIVSNNGPTSAGPVTVTNILSPNVTLETVVPALGGFYSVGRAPSGQQEVILTLPLILAQSALTSTMRVTATTSSVDTNIATVFSPLIDLVPANNSNQLVLVIDGQDLAMGMTASETNVLYGDTVVSSITVTNFGPATNGPVFITNQFSSNWTNVAVQAQGTNLVTYTKSGPLAIVNLGLLPVGQPVTATFTAMASGVGTPAYELAAVTSQDVDTNLANNGAAISYFIIGEDLAVSLSASPSSAQVGQSVTYTEQVSNLGLSTNADVLVTNTFSANLGSIMVLEPATNYVIMGNQVVFDLGMLNIGQVVPITLMATATSPGMAVDTVVLNGQDFDTNLANNTAQAAVNIVAAPPMISNLVVTPLASSAFIVWDTASPATAQVQYGAGPQYGNFSATTAAAATHHVVLLTGLTGGVGYDFEVLSWVGSALYTTNGSFSITNTLILNTQDAIYSGLWTKGTVAPGIYGTYYQYAITTVSDPTSWALYDPYIPASGLYNVYMWYPQSATFTSDAQVHVHGGTNDFVLSVNETAHGGSWQPVATNMFFTRGTNGNVTLYNNTGNTNSYLVANAMMWVYNAAQDYPANGSVPAWWADFYFGTNVSGTADADGDGYSNFAEYVLGTDPTDATSHLNFTVAPLSNNILSVIFSPCQGGRSYQLQAAADLTDPVWTTLTNSYTIGTNGSGAFTVTPNNSDRFFYRLSAQITP